MLRCPTCAVEVSDGSRVCDACGQPTVGVRHAVAVAPRETWPSACSCCLAEPAPVRRHRIRVGSGLGVKYVARVSMPACASCHRRRGLASLIEVLTWLASLAAPALLLLVGHFVIPLIVARPRTPDEVSTGQTVALVGLIVCVVAAWAFTYFVLMKRVVRTRLMARVGHTEGCAGFECVGGERGAYQLLLHNRAFASRLTGSAARMR